jgi:hypothetical protein
VRGFPRAGEKSGAHEAAGDGGEVHGGVPRRHERAERGGERGDDGEAEEFHADADDGRGEYVPSVRHDVH